ncbi:Gfo/Idh/MocA family oxidoreductase [Paenibacillus alginolyticus]|uniref:Gfo/Idh/MocA family oxidoreductase n=1 Tax=Paenibacillus alginolyticus TaxID=59839 RepID=A0ABT4GML5_9BACL|nr:Gfo/Idh/MocA family oxidoreductase [Paenibacillus alginolyticus]MCY9669193.1 Gfo/Idh/MocA family oxidoreductase [Paenibacillus alginolyticus]MCY9697444.1 Gfo/Idh/MocA family oxidoreductase [Paenibacillus alginolyticus]MEC0148477.1 Gfo/Idh/MocA family oxidoreductase [Paenibacillus alginolyticus]
MTLRVGVVGVGNIGSIHAGVYKDHAKTELVAVCDIVKEKADAAAHKYGCRAFYSVREMLESGIQLGACSVATKGEENGGEHYEPTMELLAAGIPVLGEKPISNRIDEGERMVALAKEKHVPYGINLNHRFTPAAKRAKDWIESGRLGKLHMINMKMWINNPVETSPWFHLRALHPHSFDVIRYFCGDVKRVGAFMMKGEGRTIWSNTQIILEFANGAIGNLVGSYDAGASYGLERCEVAGANGRFVLEDACEELTFYPRWSIETESYSYLGGMRHFNETFKSRISHWIEQLDAGTAYNQINGSGEDALKAQYLIEAAIRSFETSTIVEL